MASMTLSDEGVRLGMTFGTVGGMAAGIAVAAPLSGWIGTELSSLSALTGIFVGWVVASQFVKHIPRNTA